MRASLLVVVLVVVGCGGLSPAATQPAVSVDPRCIAASPALVDTLAITLDRGLSMVGVYYVKSSDFDNVYFFSGKLQGPQLNGAQKVGTWVTNRSDGTAGFYTVDPVAAQYSGWGRAANTGQKYSMSNDGATLSASCASP